MESDYLSHLFPKGLLEHFKFTGFLELGNVCNKTMFYEIQLKEANKILDYFDQNLYESKRNTCYRQVPCGKTVHGCTPTHKNKTKVGRNGYRKQCNSRRKSCQKKWDIAMKDCTD